jgi:hypothetical protein
MLLSLNHRLPLTRELRIYRTEEGSGNLKPTEEMRRMLSLMKLFSCSRSKLRIWLADKRLASGTNDSIIILININI